MKNLNRWVYVVVGVIVLMFAGLIYAWSVLKNPIATEFNWSQAQLSLTFTITMTMFCLGGLIGGLLNTKINVKINVWASALLFLIGFLIVARTQSLALLYIGFGIFGGLASGISYNAVMSTMSKWFPDKQGLISGILLMGFGIGSFIIGKVYQAYTPAGIGGWRISFTVLGIILFIVLIIGGFFFIKPDIKPDKDFISFEKLKTEEKINFVEGMDVKAFVMLKRPAFWCYFLWSVFLSAAGLALISQASGIAAEAGSHVSAATIATVVGLISIFNGIGRVIFGGMFDKAGYKVTMLTVMAAFTIMTVILILAISLNSFALIVLGFIVGGFAYGGITPTNSAIINTFYGAENYPVNFSIVNLNLIIASFGSTIAGALFDASGSYLSTFFMIIIAIILGFISFLGVRRP